MQRVHEEAALDLGPSEKKMRPSDFVEFDELLDQLASELNLARHPNSLVLLRAARSLISDDCLPSAPSRLSASQATPEQERLKEPRQTIEGDGEALGGERQRAEQSRATTNGEAGRRAEGEPPSEIRIQQAKFTLADVILPERLLGLAENNLAKQESQLDPQQVPSGSDVCVSHETRSMTVTEPMTPATTKDELVSAFESASKVLKLLYLDDQRQLQNRVNELISSVQSITANPKTDPRLLATGR